MAYAPGDVLVRAVMVSSTGLPADNVVNDFAFTGTENPDAAAWADLFGIVSDFYRLQQTNTEYVGAYISNAINRSATHELQGYNLGAGPGGSPEATEPWLGPVPTSDANALPTEVAGVLSFHADLTGQLEEAGATRPRARRRGRIYVGPLNIRAIASTAPPYMLSTDFTLTLRQAAVALYDAAIAIGYPWAVWSRADSTLREVIGGWTDNAPDTQRRRGPKSTVRVNFVP